MSRTAAASHATARPRQWLRRTLWALGTLVVLLAIAAGVGLGLGHWKMQRHVAVDVSDIPFAEPAAQTLDRGRYLYASRGCGDCHGPDGAGRVFIDDPGIGMLVVGPQIAPGANSVTKDWKPVDWVRAIRHGVKPGGRPIMVMPSEDYNRLTDTDVAAIIAHVRALPAVEGRQGKVDLPVPVRILYGFGAIQDAAAKIDHAKPPSKPVAEGVTREHGEYVAQACLGCHGPRLEGGKVPGGPPDWPPASRLVAGEGSVMSRYPDAASLMKMFRSGVRPDGSAIKVMPFEALREMKDTDVAALHLYLVGK